MRVKIAYTIDIEEVESEVSEIMSRAVNDLDFCYQELIRLQNELDTKTGKLENQSIMMETIRIKMAKADMVIADCQAILFGLDNAKKQSEENQNEIQDG